MENARSPSGYHLVKRCIIGGEGGWDYLTIDGKARRLYVTHGSCVVVMNADSVTVVGEILKLRGFME